MKHSLLLLFFLGATAIIRAQTAMDTSAVKAELDAIFKRDQKTRTGSDSAAFVAFIDSCNLAQVEAIVQKYGWLGKSAIGKYNQVLFLVIQHADLAKQVKYFPLLKASVEKGESSKADAAMLQDRILMRQGKKQIYGSQVVRDKSGEQVFYPIEDEVNVNIRRANVGLQPLEEYAKYFGIDYILPVKDEGR